MKKNHKALQELLVIEITLIFFRASSIHPLKSFIITKIFGLTQIIIRFLCTFGLGVQKMCVAAKSSHHQQWTQNLPRSVSVIIVDQERSDLKSVEWELTRWGIYSQSPGSFYHYEVSTKLITFVTVWPLDAPVSITCRQGQGRVLTLFGSRTFGSGSC